LGEFRLDRLIQAAKELSEATGQTCIPAQADVRDPKTLQEAVRKTIEKFGKIDFVICGKEFRDLRFRVFTVFYCRCCWQLPGSHIRAL
jgi:NAD(P)-dependent dehydrogenase (short-subunit alcohol dehydrogenase family)